MIGAKEIATPLSTKGPLSLNDGSSSFDATIYRQVIGALQYLSITRPDIAFVINYFNSCISHLSYIGGTPNECCGT